MRRAQHTTTLLLGCVLALGCGGEAQPKGAVGEDSGPAVEDDSGADGDGAFLGNDVPYGMPRRMMRWVWVSSSPPSAVGSSRG